MKLYIELILVFGFLLVFFIWLIWYKWSLRSLNKRYKPEDDKGRDGTEFIKRTA